MSARTMSPGFRLGQWCRTIIDCLVQTGVQHFVVSPGSRNTPLTMSGLRHPGLICHSVIDERAAAFFALGLAKATSQPVALLCTSGTAGAHYYPALIEASEACVPLVAITADRPENLQGIGAPQTINQAHLFGQHVRAFHAAPPVGSSPEDHEALARGLRELLAQAIGGKPGPVHLNVPLAKPLEPLPASSESEENFAIAVGAVLDKRVEPGSILPQQPDPALLQHVATAVASTPRLLVTLGPMAPAEHHHALALAKAWGSFVAADFGSRETSALEFMASALVGSNQPDVIVHLGAPSVSTTWANAIEQYEGAYFCLSGHKFADPSRRARAVVVGALPAAISSLKDAATAPLPQRESYTAALRELSATLNQRLTGALEPQSNDESPFHEPAAIREALQAVSGDTRLVLGNSMCVRAASWVSCTLPRWGGPPLTTRGANGIDGTIAATAGLAQGNPGPILLLVGDVTAAHDLGGWLLLRQIKTPVVVCLVDNGGGHIFDHLPARAHLNEADFGYWITPPALDFEATAMALGLAVKVPKALSDVTRVIEEALTAPRATVVILRTDPQTSVTFLAEVRRSLTHV